jgi:hypothetical protein
MIVNTGGGGVNRARMPSVAYLESGVDICIDMVNPLTGTSMP